jgi:hypothetical protein
VEKGVETPLSRVGVGGRHEALSEVAIVGDANQKSRLGERRQEGKLPKEFPGGATFSYLTIGRFLRNFSGVVVELIEKEVFGLRENCGVQVGGWSEG